MKAAKTSETAAVEARKFSDRTSTVETAKKSEGADSFFAFFAKRWSDESVGFACALSSAAFYTVSLFMLRGLTDFPELSSDWTIAMKEATTLVCVVPLIFILCLRRKYRFPSWKSTGMLIFAGLSCQVVGARPHLIAYSAIGIALATPLIQAIQLIGTSAIGAIWLRERVTATKAAAIFLLICAVGLLGASQYDGSGAIAGQPMRIGLGILCVFGAGIGYGTQMAAMRKVLRFRSENEIAENGASEPVRTPTTLAMIAVTGVGFVVCASCLAVERGFGAFLAPPPICWALVLTAGVANMIGFFFQIEGLRRLYASKSTLVAASQTLTLSILGIAYFGEPLNAAVILGLVLVAVGVGLAGFSK